jgi:hypothetical protein
MMELRWKRGAGFHKGARMLLNVEFLPVLLLLRDHRSWRNWKHNDCDEEGKDTLGSTWVCINEEAMEDGSGKLVL